MTRTQVLGDKVSLSDDMLCLYVRDSRLGYDSLEEVVSQELLSALHVEKY